MKELEYRLARFGEQFRAWKGKKIFLYGAGLNVKKAMELYGAEYRFGAIIVPDEEKEKACADKAFSDIPVVSMEEALIRRPDVIVIAAQMYSAEIVYQRICGKCKENRIPLMDLYGTDQIALHEELENQPFLDLAGWQERTKGYDVVSFELRDTLIERDLFRNRDGRVRPIFRHLIPDLKKRGVRILYIAHPDQPEEWYRRILAEEGIYCQEDDSRDLFLVQSGREDFFRLIKETMPRKKCLHIGYSILENGIMPRNGGFDTCRMVFFDRKMLTSFRSENGIQTEEGTDAGKKPDLKEYTAEITRAETVSFDIFDTLLVRRTKEVRDVFLMTALCAESEGILKGSQIPGFVRMREKAQTATGTLQDIYRNIGKHFGLSETAKDRAAAIELEMEDAVLAPRKAAAGLLEQAVKNGKKVILISDMYLSSEQLSALLEKKGISGYEKIFVSCEYTLGKRDGLLRLAAEEMRTPPEKMVHLGDSEQYDAFPAKRAGIRFLKIPSVRELSEEAGTEPDTRERKETDKPAEVKGRLAADLLFGTWRAFRFNDPFSERPEWKREEILYYYGYTAMAPVVAGWLFWMFERIRKEAPDRILFAARDGWRLSQLYEEWKTEAFPDPVYFYVSRLAAFRMSADRMEEEGYIADMAGDMPPSRILEKIFGLKCIGLQTGKEADKTGQDGMQHDRLRIEEAIREQADKIREKALSVRKGYLEYCRREGIIDTKENAYVDFVASGTSQRFLEEVSPFDLKGCYFGHSPVASEKDCCSEVYISGGTEAEQKFLSRYMEMEYYMTSPEPSLLEYDESGLPVFAEEVRTGEELKDIADADAGVRGFFTGLRRLYGTAKIIGGTGDKEETDTAVYRELQKELSADLVCRLYLASTLKEVRQRYFDDWSGREL